MDILDATTRAAVAAATDQEAELTAAAALWAGGDVALDYYAGATLLRSVVHGPWVINTAVTPRESNLGAYVSSTGSTAGTPTRVVARAGSTDVLQWTCGVGSGEVSMSAAIGTTGIPQVGTARGGSGLKITARSGLPVVGLPTWREGLAVNAWVEIAGTSGGGATPTNTVTTTAGGSAVLGASARLDAWCGLSIDTRSSTVWGAANGGHGDYFGNEVVALDLMADAPAWVEYFAGSSGNVADAVTTGADRSHALYLNAPGGTAGTGKPCSRHSYYGQQFIEAHDRAICLGGSSSPLGSAFENVEAFDIVGMAWDSYNANTQEPPYGYCIGSLNAGWTTYIGWGACKDPATECVYTVTQSKLRKMTPAATPGSATWSEAGNTPWTPNTGAYGAMAVDTLRNRIIWVQGSSIVYWDIATYTPTETAFPASAAATAMAGATALTGGAVAPMSCGIVYEPTLDAYLIRMGAAGATVYKVDAATFEVSEMSTTGGGGVPSAAPFSDQQGIYTRWLYAPTLGGVVYFPKASANAWFLRTH